MFFNQCSTGRQVVPATSRSYHQSSRRPEKVALLNFSYILPQDDLLPVHVYVQINVFTFKSSCSVFVVINIYTRFTWVPNQNPRFKSVAQLLSRLPSFFKVLWYTFCLLKSLNLCLFCLLGKKCLLC